MHIHVPFDILFLSYARKKNQENRESGVVYGENRDFVRSASQNKKPEKQAISEISSATAAAAPVTTAATNSCVFSYSSENSSKIENSEAAVAKNKKKTQLLLPQPPSNYSTDLAPDRFKSYESEREEDLLNNENSVTESSLSQILNQEVEDISHSYNREIKQNELEFRGTEKRDTIQETIQEPIQKTIQETTKQETKKISKNLENSEKSLTFFSPDREKVAALPSNNIDNNINNNTIRSTRPPSSLQTPRKVILQDVNQLKSDQINQEKTNIHRYSSLQQLHNTTRNTRQFTDHNSIPNSIPKSINTYSLAQESATTSVQNPDNSLVSKTDETPSSDFETLDFDEEVNNQRKKTSKISKNLTIQEEYRMSHHNPSGKREILQNYNRMNQEAGSGNRNNSSSSQQQQQRSGRSSIVSSSTITSMKTPMSGRTMVFENKKLESGFYSAIFEQ